MGNYLITALRHLWRERGDAAINIFGLAIGLALCLRSSSWPITSSQWATFMRESRVFRVLASETGSTGYTSAVPVPLGPTLEERLPQVEKGVRFGWPPPSLLRVGDKEGIYEQLVEADRRLR